MSKNLDAVIRYRIINSCLRNKFKLFPTKLELLEACEEALGASVSERTIDKDLNEMRFNESLGYFAPIIFDRKTKGYSYEDPNYSIDAIPIGKSDLNAIEFAAEILGQYKNVNILNEFKGAVDKIVDTVKVQRMLFDEPTLQGSVQLDNMDYIPGSEHLNNLIECIKSKYVCDLSYKKFGSEESKQYLFEPFILKEYNGLWYVTGKFQEKDSIRTFALDRITDINVTEVFFKTDTSFDKEIYYNNVYGVTHNQTNPEQIVIKTDLGAARYLEIKPIHKSQKEVRRNNDFVWFELTLVLNIELETKLMSLGNGCTIESPSILRDSIKQRLEKALTNYR